MKKVSKEVIKGMNIGEIKTGFFMLQHKESIIEALKSKRELLGSVLGDYKKEHKELNDLLEPFLTLEKL